MSTIPAVSSVQESRPEAVNLLPSGSEEEKIVRVAEPIRRSSRSAFSDFKRKEFSAVVASEPREPSSKISQTAALTLSQCEILMPTQVKKVRKIEPELSAPKKLYYGLRPNPSADQLASSLYNRKLFE